MQELLTWVPGGQGDSREAGRILHDIYHGGQFERQLKGDATPVTSADLAADAYLKQALSALTPYAGADRRGCRHPLQPARQLAGDSAVWYTPSTALANLSRAAATLPT